MRTSFHGYVADSAHGIDLASMLDFVVNLLIFFIIAAVFVKETGVTVSRPTGSTGDEPSQSLVIDEDGTTS
jgi:biopolymer transport protein ExbD